VVVCRTGEKQLIKIIIVGSIIISMPIIRTEAVFRVNPHCCGQPRWFKLTHR
jgi:hypothetical protein